jgi:hypothetical protein
MTKYSLLLGAILKYTDDPEERLCLEEMVLGESHKKNNPLAFFRPELKERRTFLFSHPFEILLFSTLKELYLYCIDLEFNSLCSCLNSIDYQRGEIR